MRILRQQLSFDGASEAISAVLGNTALWTFCMKVRGTRIHGIPAHCVQLAACMEEGKGSLSSRNQSVSKRHVFYY